ncbi:MAG: hypothetical protein J3K34DRAFT_401646 [Monoraphidium minutum]|nr:MAG: hypothetical protein J3K34DRAFT_401646 [Monoraphidium minutum]
MSTAGASGPLSPSRALDRHVPRSAGGGTAAQPVAGRCLPAVAPQRTSAYPAFCPAPPRARGAALSSQKSLPPQPQPVSCGSALLPAPMMRLAPAAQGPHGRSQVPLHLARAPAYSLAAGRWTCLGFTGVVPRSARGLYWQPADAPPARDWVRM